MTMIERLARAAVACEVLARCELALLQAHIDGADTAEAQSAFVQARRVYDAAQILHISKTGDVVLSWFTSTPPLNRRASIDLEVSGMSVPRFKIGDKVIRTRAGIAQEATITGVSETGAVIWYYYDVNPREGYVAEVGNFRPRPDTGTGGEE